MKSMQKNIWAGEIDLLFMETRNVLNVTQEQALGSSLSMQKMTKSALIGHICCWTDYITSPIAFEKPDKNTGTAWK